MKAGDLVYRYDYIRTGHLDEFENVSSIISLNLARYNVLKITPKGYWVDDFGHRRFIRASGKKKFAHPSRLEALNDFLYRKNLQKKHLKRTLKEVDCALNIGEDLKNAITQS